MMKAKKEPTEVSHYLTCERRDIYALLMLSAGMMGAYTYILRGGVFCNAQTANVLMMSISFGRGNWREGLYYLIPISAYFLGALISEALPSPVKKLGFLRWDTYLVAFEMIVLLIIGFIPLSVPNQIVQVMINFIASMQYNTFRQMEGIPMATTFCTNHIRQVGIAMAKAIRKKDGKAAKRGLIHLGMILCFFVGSVLLTLVCQYLTGNAIWIALIPMAIALGKLIHADLTSEHTLLGQKPSGH